jgi:2-aminobenzoate-CoA ligase
MTSRIDTFARDHLPPREQWPDFLFDRPEYRYPQRVNCAVELLDRRVASGDGQRTALTTIVNGRAIGCTYQQLFAQVNRIARVLTEDLGLVPGNRVLLRAPNSPMLAACWLAIVKAGLIAVGTAPLLRARELKPIIDRARIGAALCDIQLRDELLLAHDPASRALRRRSEAGALPERSVAEGPRITRGAQARRVFRASQSPRRRLPDRIHIRHDR